ncbi:MAG: TPM domain-containing protein [Polyangiaceae bacterium]
MTLLSCVLVLLWFARRRDRLGWLPAPVLAACAALVVSACPMTAHAMPTRTGWVTDEAHALPPETLQDLDRELAEFAERTSFEVAVVTVRSLEGKSLEDFSLELAKGWELGEAGADNGVLLLVVIDDHKMRIETGKGIGDRLTDLEARDILDSVMRPKLRAGDTAGALQEGARAVMKKLDRSPQQVAAETHRPWWHWALGIFGLLAVLRLAVELHVPLAKRWRERVERKRKIASDLAEAEEAQPPQRDFDELLAAFEAQPWASRPILAGVPEGYARAFAKHTEAHQNAARAVRTGETEDPARQAAEARTKARLAREVLVHIKTMLGDGRQARIREAFSSLDEAHALIAQLDEQKIAHDAAEPLSAAEELITDGFRIAADAHYLINASRVLDTLIDTLRGHLEAMAGQHDALSSLAHSLDGAEAPIKRGEAVFRQFRSDFPAETDGESPAAILAEARAALVKARASEGIRSSEAITRVNDAAQEATRLLTRARSVSDHAPRLAVERAARKPVLAKRLEELRALLFQLRPLANAPKDAITTVAGILHAAERQQALGDQGDLATALKDTLRAIQIAEDARTSATESTSDTWSGGGGWSSSDSSASSSYDSSGSSSSSYDSGSSGSYDSGSSSGGGDFGGGGASSDW